MKPNSDLVLTVNEQEPNSFFSDQSSFLVVLANIFGLMPLKCYKSNRKCKFKFKWKSFLFFYSIFNVLGTFVGAMFCIAEFCVYGFLLDKAGVMEYYIMNTFGAIKFVNLSMNWNLIMQEWNFMEISLKHYGPVKNFKKRLHITTIVFMVLAIVEHIFFIVNGWIKSEQCLVMNNDQNDRLKTYFVIEFPQVFKLINFTYVAAILVKIVNILSTFTWNFTDLLLILISSALALRFNQLAAKISNKRKDEIWWMERREEFSRLCHLTRVVDEHFSFLVSVSFINNMFFICIQLYNSLKEREGVMEKVYYFYSFGFLIFRTAAVTLYAAWINDESKKPLITLLSVSSKEYNPEISRFIEQINAYPIGITGSNFFLVTRNLLLQMIGTIVTFELMLLEFGPTKIKLNVFNNTCY